MSSSLRRSQQAVAAAVTLRRGLCAAATTAARAGDVKTVSAPVERFRPVAEGGSGGGDPLSGGVGENWPSISCGGGGNAAPQGGRDAPRVLGVGGQDESDFSSRAMQTAQTATAASAGERGQRTHAGQAPSRRSPRGLTNTSCRRRPPLFFSSTTSRGTTPYPPPPRPTAPKPAAAAAVAAAAEVAATAGMAGPASPRSTSRKPRGGTSLDFAASSSSSSSTFSSAYGGGGGSCRGSGSGSGSGGGAFDDGGGGGAGGDVLGLHHSSRRVFSSLPVDKTASNSNSSTSSSGGIRPGQHPPQAQPPKVQQQQAQTPHAQQQQQQQQQQNRPLSPQKTAADEELLASLSVQEATPLSLRDLHAFCQSTTPASRMLQARFLHREVPIRFAKRALELRHLPYGLSHTAPVVEAAEWYARIMRELVAYPVPAGATGDQDFAAFLSSLLMDHTCVPYALVRGVLELEEKSEVDHVQRHRIDRILDNFFISRISFRFLVDTYIASKKNKPGFSGVIESECSPVLVAWRAAADVDRLCRVHMGIAPAIEVFGRAEDTFTAVPSHLYYIIREVLKNSCRATVEHGRRTRPGEKLPPVKIIVARGNEDMTIKIVDEGGGIRRSDLQRVWSYMYSTAPKPTASQLTGVPLDHMSGMRLKEEEAALRDAPKPDSGTTFAFAGFGMGLPLSRLYARYFGGSLKLRPMEGYGTDAYIHLHRLRTNSEEHLPNSLEETLRVMADDGRVNVTRGRSWKQPACNDDPARELIRSFGKGL